MPETHHLPPPVTLLVAALRRLPGMGPRSAERLALHIIQADSAEVRHLADSLISTRERVGTCTRCGSLTESQPCPICTGIHRDATQLCIVERALDVLSLEKASVFKGHYHVLGGRLSPLNGVGPEDLRIHSLLERVASGTIREVILALGSDVESDATCHYLVQRLAGTDVTVTRLAQGLPAGSGLEFADELTLGKALEGRRGYQ